MPQLKRGILITVEGIDGSGKSTFAGGLNQVFIQKQFNVVLTKEPGGSHLGIQLRAILQKQETPLDAKAEYLLFAADRAQHFSQLVIPFLQEKKLILSDRMAGSSLAYQGYGRGLDQAIIKSVNSWAMQEIKPDLTLYIKVPVPVALKRVNQRKTLTAFEQQAAFLTRVANGFDTMYQNCSDVFIFDGTQPPEMIIQNALSYIEQWLKKNKLLS